MPVEFLSDEQAATYGRFAAPPASRCGAHLKNAFGTSASYRSGRRLGVGMGSLITDGLYRRRSFLGRDPKVRVSSLGRRDQLHHFARVGSHALRICFDIRTHTQNLEDLLDEFSNRDPSS